MDVRGDGAGMMTGGADKEVKFWSFEVEGGGEGGGQARLSLRHVRSLRLEEDVLAVRYSNTRSQARLLVAVALLDSTVKVFFDDSLKFFLSLYGHQLPVLALDVSHDDELLVTASADRTVKIWGLDFGDCHRSLRAHQDSVMAVRFLPGTHSFFSAGKDKLLKYWDADSFELILTHRGHAGEVWAMGVEGGGEVLATGGADRSVRVWERSDDQVFVEEERQRELEGMFEDGVGKEGREEGEEGAESGRAGRQHIESVKQGERLSEALEVMRADDGLEEEHLKFLKAARQKPGAPLPPPRPPNPLMLNLLPHRFLLFHLRLLKGPDLEQALLVLPLDLMHLLLRGLCRLLREDMEVELCWRCLLFLFRTHHRLLLHSRDLMPLLMDLRGGLRERLKRFRDGVAMNVEGLRLLKREVEEGKQAFLVPGEGEEEDGEKKRARRE
jgi:U3 small nucleolar RNA-associated protein 12